MNDIPSWWLILSGIFFVLNIIWFAILSIVMLKLVSVVSGLQPEIRSLSERVKTLVDKVEDLAVTVKETVADVGSKTKGVVGSVELVAQTASRQFERFSPLVIGALSLLRVMRAVGDMRGGHDHPRDEKPKKKSKKGLLHSLIG